MVKLTDPKAGRKRRTAKPRCVRVPGYACPVHGSPVYLASGLLFCPGCLRYVPTRRK